MNTTILAYGLIALKTAAEMEATQKENLFYLGGGLVTIIIAAVLMQLFIYNPVMETLKNVRPAKMTPFFENEQFYAFYLVWCGDNNAKPHFLKRNVPVEAVYDNEE